LLNEQGDGAGLERHLAAHRDGSAGVPLNRHEFRNTDQIVGDEIEQKVAGHAANAAMLGFSKGAMLLASAEDALDHRAT
jgi:hypothetical protein